MERIGVRGCLLLVALTLACKETEPVFDQRAARDVGSERPAPLTCDDGQKDGDETSVDCGGSCPRRCGYNQGCLEDRDCQSGSCDSSTRKCGVGLCSDGTKDGDETDIDCGGSCPSKCGDGQGCAAGGDCQSGSCDGATKKCKATLCSDAVKDGNETDIDCGGSCPKKCGDGQVCAVGTDCQSGSCDGATRRCKAGLCSDAVKDGDETDIDCGGPCPQKCGVGQGCAAGGDCQSGTCDSVTRRCTSSLCSDAVKDGDETDVHCGGPCPRPCSYNQGCLKGSDCQSGACNATTKKCE